MSVSHRHFIASTVYYSIQYITVPIQAMHATVILVRRSLCVVKHPSRLVINRELNAVVLTRSLVVISLKKTFASMIGKTAKSDMGKLSPQGSLNGAKVTPSNRCYWWMFWDSVGVSSP